MFVDIVSLLPGFNLPFPFGTLYQSNSNGDYFTVSLQHTNRDLSTGMVDFEHIQSAMYEGVLLANIVRNWRNIVNRNAIVKELSTVMSFDNGRRWSSIIPPSQDSEGKKFKCTPVNTHDDNCSLNLHSVTTTKNIGRVFSASSAPGTIVGVGNVGPSLLPYDDCDTFVSDDSGMTWREVHKGPHKFEIIDLGSVISLIPDGREPVSYFLYSKDRGQTWEKQELMLDGGSWMPYFTNIDANSTSTKMILSASKGVFSQSKYIVQIDFQSIFPRKCSSERTSSNPDLEKWSLKPLEEYCVLGTTWEHYRRKATADCLYFSSRTFSLAFAFCRESLSFS
jgi:hypothetical protein